MDAHVVYDSFDDESRLPGTVIGVRVTLDGAKSLADLGELPHEWAPWHEVPNAELDFADRAWHRRSAPNQPVSVQTIEVFRTGPRAG